MKRGLLVPIFIILNCTLLSAQETLVTDTILIPRSFLIAVYNNNPRLFPGDLQVLNQGLKNSISLESHLVILKDAIPLIQESLDLHELQTQARSQGLEFILILELDQRSNGDMFGRLSLFDLDQERALASVDLPDQSLDHRRRNLGSRYFEPAIPSLESYLRPLQDEVMVTIKGIPGTKLISQGKVATIPETGTISLASPSGRNLPVQGYLPGYFSQTTMVYVGQLAEGETQVVDLTLKRHDLGLQFEGGLPWLSFLSISVLPQIIPDTLYGTLSLSWYGAGLKVPYNKEDKDLFISIPLWELGLGVLYYPLVRKGGLSPYLGVEILGRFDTTSPLLVDGLSPLAGNVKLGVEIPLDSKLGLLLEYRPRWTLSLDPNLAIQGDNSGNMFTLGPGVLEPLIPYIALRFQP